MAGRRSTGASAAIIGNVYQKSVDRRLAQEDERTKFDQRLQALGIAAGLESGAIAPQFQGGQFQGFQQGQSQPVSSGIQSQLMETQGQGELPEGTTIRQTIKTPQGTITITRGGQKPKPQSFLPGGEAAQIFGQATPGQPLPMTRPGAYDQQTGENRSISNIPQGNAGINSMNQGILRGMSESPAAASLGNRLAPHTIPQGPFLEGPAGQGGFIGGSQLQVMPGFESLLQPRQSVVDLAGQGDLRQKAIQELQAAGAPVTEANIQEAIRQLADQ